MQEDFDLQRPWPDGAGGGLVAERQKHRPAHRDPGARAISCRRPGDDGDPGMRKDFLVCFARHAVGPDLDDPGLARIPGEAFQS